MLCKLLDFLACGLSLTLGLMNSLCLVQSGFATTVGNLLVLLNRIGFLAATDRRLLVP